MTAELCRVWLDEKQTLGQIDVIDPDVSLLSMPPKPSIVFTCFTLELPWKNNERRVSCIPDGTYKCTRENHKKFGWCYRLHDVPNRDGILIHPLTNHTQSLGCIGPALDQKDMNGDGLLDNVSSRAAMAKLTALNFTEIKIYTRA